MRDRTIAYFSMEIAIEPAMPTYSGGLGVLAGDRSVADAESLYWKLESVIIPMYYRQSEDLWRVIRHAIALNGSYFNTQRMVMQYVLKAYFD